MKKVSVIIPTYKRYDVLMRCVKSVAEQDYENIEIIIVDDNDPLSLDRKNTELVVSLLKEEYGNLLKYIKHPKNLNGSYARNTGFMHSTGDYIMFLDDDDVFLPGKIREQVIQMESLDEQWGLSYCRYIRVKKNGRFLEKSKESREGSLLVDALSRNLFICGGSTLIIRREIIEKLKGFDTQFKRNQDLEFLVRALRISKIACCDICGVKIYNHEGENRRFDEDEITKNFITSFKTEIDSLTPDEKKIVMKNLGLQRIRYLLFKKKQLKKARKVAKDNDISTREVLSYILYLMKRKIFHMNIGYNIKCRKVYGNNQH